MPPKRGKAAKAKEPNDAETIMPVDVQYNPEIVSGLLQDLAVDVETKCQQMQKDIDFMATSMKQAFYLELIKIPTQVKNMPLSKFKEEYGDSLEAVNKGAMSSINKTSKTVSKQVECPSAMKSTRASTRSVFQTPMGGKNRVAETPMRAPLEGETILSSNGSPLGTFVTAVKAPKSENHHSIIPATPGGSTVSLNNGDVVNIEDVGSLPEDMKQDALEKMENMMSNMQAMMQKLKKPTAAL